MQFPAVISLTLVAVVTARVNYTELQLCTIGDGQPGVMCGEWCQATLNWCRDDLSLSCSTNTTKFSTRDVSLCRNSTFWSNVSCTFYYSDGLTVFAYGKRCSANKQHCYYPWYTKNTADFTDWRSTCQDKSDRIFDINTKCNITAYIKEYCETICNENNKHRYCKENICQNPTEWIARQTDSYIVDPHKCESSCQNPSRGCDACTNTEAYFNCPKSGVCIHKDLLCDGHKHCKHGEDEDSCKNYSNSIPFSTSGLLILVLILWNNI